MVLHNQPIPLFATALLALLFAPIAGAHESQAEAPEVEPAVTGESMDEHHDRTMGGTQRFGMSRLAMPRMDPARGRKLFADKGCVACHSINGVGGHDATNLDAHTMKQVMNPFDFAAKMWSMAPAMITAQEEGLGGQILFTGQELADIIAFVHSDEEQHNFSEADLSHEVRMMMHHSHGAPGGGPKEHGEEIGHMHGEGMQEHQD